MLPEEGSSGNLPALGGPDLMLEENPGDPGLQPCCAEVAERGQAVGGGAQSLTAEPRSLLGAMSSGQLPSAPRLGRA